MNKDLLHFYNQELTHIREKAAEFSQAYPKVAGRLSLENIGHELCPDPFVERLLEGFAYLSARIQMKLYAEFPRVTGALLENVAPSYLTPIPSMAIIAFEPEYENKTLKSGFSIPRESKLHYHASKAESTPCTFQTSLPVFLWPIRLTDSSYKSRDLISMDLPTGTRGSSAILMRFETTGGQTFSQLPLESLTLYITGGSAKSSLIHEQILANNADVLVRNPRAGEKNWITLTKDCISPVGLDRCESLLPCHIHEESGYRLLREYFAFPQTFLFFKISHLDEVLSRIDGDVMEVLITLKGTEESLENQIDKNSFALYCTPAVNLFEKKTDRVLIKSNSAGDEYHVVADKTAPIDYEIHSILSVVGYGTDLEEGLAFKSFYHTTDEDSDSEAYFTVNRVPRTLSERERRYHTDSSYVGSEVYVSLVDGSNSPLITEVKQLGITALCTNRHLPTALRKGSMKCSFSSLSGGPITQIRCIEGPTSPQPSYSMRENAWRLVSHLTLNFFSIADTDDKQKAEALKEILKLYVMPYDQTMQKHVEGIVSMNTHTIVKRVFRQGIFSFLKGLEITVTMDENLYVGTGIFILGMILDRLFARHVSLNTFTETVIKSTTRGEIIRWPARLGGRKLL